MGLISFQLLFLLLFLFPLFFKPYQFYVLVQNNLLAILFNYNFIYYQL